MEKEFFIKGRERSEKTREGGGEIKWHEKSPNLGEKTRVD